MSNRYSEYTVSQIAEACGYSDPLYFSRVFKKYFGVAPSEYK
jgi:AraC-like DNA-binding protein